MPHGSQEAAQPAVAVTGPSYVARLSARCLLKQRCRIRMDGVDDCAVRLHRPDPVHEPGFCHDLASVISVGMPDV